MGHLLAVLTNVLLITDVLRVLPTIMLLITNAFLSTANDTVGVG